MSSHAAVHVVQQYNDMKIYIFTKEDPWVYSYLTRVHGSKIYKDCNGQNVKKRIMLRISNVLAIINCIILYSDIHEQIQSFRNEVTRVCGF